MNKLLVLIFPLLFSLLSFEGRTAANGKVNIERNAVLSDVLDSQSLQVSEEADSRDEDFYVGFKFPTLLIPSSKNYYFTGVQPSFRQIYDLGTIRAPPFNI